MSALEEGERRGREEGERRGREGALAAFSAGGGDVEWQRRVEEAWREGERRGREEGERMGRDEAANASASDMRKAKEMEAELRRAVTLKEDEVRDARGELARRDAELAEVRGARGGLAGRDAELALLAEAVKDREGKMRALQVGLAPPLCWCKCASVNGSLPVQMCIRKWISVPYPRLPTRTRRETCQDGSL